MSKKITIHKKNKKDALKTLINSNSFTSSQQKDLPKETDSEDTYDIVIIKKNINGGTMWTKPQQEYLNRMENRLNKRIDDSEERLNQKIDDTEERLNQKIEDTEVRLNQKIDDSEERLNQKIEDTEERLNQKIEDVKTELLDVIETKFDELKELILSLHK